MSTIAAPDRRILDPLENLLGYQMRRASALMMADLAAGLASCDLRPAEASILLLVAANPRVTQSEIGRRLGIKRANMTPLVAALEARGLIDRAAVDGRSQGLRLSRSGAALAARAREVVEDHDARIFGDMSARQRQMLMACVRRIRERYAAGEEQGG